MSGYRILEEHINEEGERVLDKVSTTDAFFISADLNDEGVEAFKGTTGTDTQVEVVMYRTAILPWWKHWYYTIAGRLRDVPYPEEIMAHGLATLDADIEEDGSKTTVKGHFKSDGKWEIK
jgi:hypothetical protein